MSAINEQRIASIQRLAPVRGGRWAVDICLHGQPMQTHFLSEKQAAAVAECLRVAGRYSTREIEITGCFDGPRLFWLKYHIKRRQPQTFPVLTPEHVAVPDDLLDTYQ